VWEWFFVRQVASLLARRTSIPPYLINNAQIGGLEEHQAALQKTIRIIRVNL